MTCSQCQSQQAAGATRCASCDAALGSNEYDPVLLRLQTALAGIARGDAPLTQRDGLFRSLMGSVQNILDRASDDLQKGYRELHRQRGGKESETGKQVADFVVDFGDLQDDMHTTVKKIGEIFGQCQNLDDFQLYLPVVDGHLTSLQASIDGLERLCRQSSSATLAEYPREPLPQQVSSALEHYDGAVKALLSYMEGNRDLSHIGESLRLADLARNELCQLLEGRS